MSRMGAAQPERGTDVPDVIFGLQIALYIISATKEDFMVQISRNH